MPTLTATADNTRPAPAAGDGKFSLRQARRPDVALGCASRHAAVPPLDL